MWRGREVWKIEVGEMGKVEGCEDCMWRGDREGSGGWERRRRGGREMREYFVSEGEGVAGWLSRGQGIIRVWWGGIGWHMDLSMEE